MKKAHVLCTFLQVWACGRNRQHQNRDFQPPTLLPSCLKAFLTQNLSNQGHKLLKSQITLVDCSEEVFASLCSYKYPHASVSKPHCSAVRHLKVYGFSEINKKFTLHFITFVINFETKNVFEIRNKGKMLQRRNFFFHKFT